MEKLLVITGIWAMCALGAVFFIRGATAPGERRMNGGRATPDDVADGASR